MKELSIEQKAKSFDNIIEKANKMHSENCEACQICIEELIPELCESEDENIRKTLLESFYSYKDEEWIRGIKVKDVIAWLEKHSSSQTKEINVKHNHADKVDPKFHKGEWIVWKNKCYKVNYNGCGYELIDQNGLSTSLEFGTVDTSARLWDVTKDAKVGDVLACESGWTCIFKTLINDETFSSHCFMDKTKWFCETGSECHTLKEEFVKAYTGKIYPATKEQHDLLFQKMHEAGYEFDFEKKELKKIEQKPTDRVKPKFNVGDTMRTLQEAKDGWTDGMPVVVSIDEEYYHCNNELIAIKDQDDYEFPPMNRKHDICDSCYEQKPTDKKGMNLAEEEMTPFQKKVFDIIDTAIEEEQGLKQVCDELLRLAHDESIQKPAWSEEDEKMCQEAIDWFEKKCFPYALESENPARESIKWLKSLKDRVQLKQEWNEDYISKSLEKCRDSYGHLDKLRIIDWLKSIKDRVQPQSRQEWSEKDYNMLGALLNYCEHSIAYNGKGTLQANVWEQRKDWLKSLRPQNRWKPSDEQIKVCKEVYADILFTKGFDLSTINGELNRLEEELKKLKE